MEISPKEVYTFFMAGSLREKRPGVWELRVRLGFNPISGKYERFSKTFHGGKREASKALAKLVTVADEESFKPITRFNVQALIQATLRSKMDSADISPTTMNLYKARAQLILDDEFSGISLKKISAWDIEQFYSRLRAQKRGATVIAQTHRFLNTCLNQAVEWDWIATNPMKKSLTPKIPKVTKKVPSVAKVSKMVHAMADVDVDLSIMIALAAVTGIRRGAWCGLRWIDIEKDQIVLRGHLVTAGNDVIERPAKWRSEGEEEFVQIGPDESALLKRLHAIQAERAVEAETTVPPNGFLLSRDGIGYTPRNPKTVNAVMRRVGRANDCEFTPHDLRRFAATEMIAHGVDPVTAAERLHHKDPSLTLKTYAKTDRERERAAGLIMSELMDTSN